MRRQKARMSNDREDLSSMLESCMDDLLRELDLKLDDYTFNHDEIRGMCPVHEGDNLTAWTYYYQKGLWFCWTRGCHRVKGADLIGLIACRRELDVAGACRWAQKFLRDRNITQQDIAVRLRTRAAKEDKINYWQEHVLQKPYPDSVLKKLKDADRYLKSRDFDPEICKLMGIGYASKGRMRSRVVFPIKNIDGKIVGFTGRTVLDLKRLKRVPKWLHWPRRPRFQTGLNLFNLDRASKCVRKTGSVLLVEGPFDVVKLEMAGYQNAVAVFGLNVTKGQIEILKKCGVIHVVLAFDPDKVDSREVRGTISKLQESDFNVKILRWRGDEDVGAMEISKLHEIMAQARDIPNFDEWRRTT